MFVSSDTLRVSCGPSTFVIAAVSLSLFFLSLTLSISLSLSVTPPVRGAPRTYVAFGHRSSHEVCGVSMWPLPLHCGNIVLA